MGRGTDFNYLPIDISENVILNLLTTLPESLPGLKVQGLNGDYFNMLKKAASASKNRKVVLCLGGNIGNMPVEDAYTFSHNLHSYLNKGDIAIMGFDLKKNPAVIKAAYDDAAGVTKRFNLNLLTRINSVLNADFDISNFEHYCSYDPETGACKSYLVSLSDVKVQLGETSIRFKKDEYIWMEISQKYSVDQINQMAYAAGFLPLEHLKDSKKWFSDSVWYAI